METASAEVLDTYNGRPTAWLSSDALHWMLLGHVEPFDLWLEVPLRPLEREALLHQVPDDLDRFASSLVGRAARFTFSIDGDPVAARTLHVASTTRSIVADGVLSLAEFLDREARATTEGPRRDLLVEAGQEMRGLSGRDWPMV